MKKIETSLESLQEDVRAFYNPALHHFISMNGVDLGSNQMEFQWFFCDYAHPCEETVFYTIDDAGKQIPSIRNIVGSAWVAEAELVDLLGISIEGTSKGFVLEPDFQTAPLRKK